MSMGFSLKGPLEPFISAGQAACEAGLGGGRGLCVAWPTSRGTWAGPKLIWQPFSKSKGSGLGRSAASGISHHPAHQKLMVMACHVGCQTMHVLLIQQLQTHTWNSLLSVHLGCRIF